MNNLLSSTMYKFVDRSANVREIDRTEKNCFSWKWLEDKDVAGDFMSESGYVTCQWCNEKIKYGASSKKDSKTRAKKKFNISLKQSEKLNIFHREAGQPPRFCQIFPGFYKKTTFLPEGLIISLKMYLPLVSDLEPFLHGQGTRGLYL